jgi:hypothetical protein
MSAPNGANPCCSTQLQTNVPGPQGNAGTNGTNGVNALSIVQTAFVVPAIASSVSVVVDNNSWMVVGQNVFVYGAGYFSVNSLAGTTVAGLTYLDYVGNTAAGNTVNPGAQISPAGTQATFTDPLPLANGGTGGTTKATAQAALGLGQNATVATVSGLTQDLSATPTLVAGCTVTAPAAGSYLILSTAEIEYVGATFAASNAITLAVVDTTSSTTETTTARQTGIMTAATLPSEDIISPFNVVTLAANDVLQLQISVATAASAGHAYVVSASLCLVPLALS